MNCRESYRAAAVGNAIPLNRSTIVISATRRDGQGVEVLTTIDARTVAQRWRHIAVGASRRFWMANESQAVNRRQQTGTNFAANHAVAVSRLTESFIFRSVGSRQRLNVFAAPQLKRAQRVKLIFKHGESLGPV
jgi:hypothetical protein